MNQKVFAKMFSGRKKRITHRPEWMPHTNSLISLALLVKWAMWSRKHIGNEIIDSEPRTIGRNRFHQLGLTW